MTDSEPPARTSGKLIHVERINAIVHVVSLRQVLFVSVFGERSERMLYLEGKKIT